MDTRYEDGSRNDLVRRIITAMIMLILVLTVCFGIRISNIVKAQPQEAVTVSDPILEESWSDDVRTVTTDAVKQANEAIAVLEAAKETASESAGMSY